jgi:SAM-dependent methyltransferase
MFCGSGNLHSVVDLGMSPLCESYVPAERLNEMEPFYPLHVFVCADCYLVQLDEYVGPEDIFSEYAYFSSYSDSWVKHMEKYAHAVTDRLSLNAESLVIEVGSNDGYLLKHFAGMGIPVLGIEPAANVAQTAIDQGIPTWVEFFGVETARQLVAEGRQADLIAGANVMAQIPDINDFVEGLRIALKPEGVITIEFPHLMRLIEGNQFDTIYHEHFSYFSLYSAERIFEAHGLAAFDVEELKSHGGSLRVHARHAEGAEGHITARLRRLRETEGAAGVDSLSYYADFAERVKETKRKLLAFLIDAKRENKKISGYGAPGKGNTLLNYCGVRTDFLDFTVDRNPYKQGKFLPGTHIPIHHPERIGQEKPDYIVILPWNLKAEISEQLSYVREWGAKFVVPIPETQVF